MKTAPIKITYLIKDLAGRGYLSPFASTSFDLPSNWITNKKTAKVFNTFHEASAHVQAFRIRADIVGSDCL